MAAHATAEQQVPRYARARRLADLLDISIATVWRWTEAQRIPPPRQLGPGVTVWDIDAVLAALERDAERAAERDAERTAERTANRVAKRVAKPKP